MNTVVTRMDDNEAIFKKILDVEADATRWVSAQVTDLASGNWLDPERRKVTFEDFAEQWKAGSVGVRESTKARDDSYIKSLINPTFGTTPLAVIGHAQVQTWVAKLTTKYAAGTVVKAKQIFGKVTRRGARPAYPGEPG